MKKLALAALVAVMLVRPAYALECAPLTVLLKDILAERGYAFLSTAITKEHIPIQIFVNGKTGAWLMIGIDTESLEACVIASGYDWNFAFERGA